MLETIIGSSVIGALIAAITTGIFKLLDNDREGRIRREERVESRKDRAAEVALEDKRVRANSELERLKERKADGRAQALVLLSHSEKLDGFSTPRQPLGRTKPIPTRASCTVRYAARPD